MNICCASVYWCPTAGDWECVEHGGFDTCCTHPELHCWEHPFPASTNVPCRSCAADRKAGEVA